MVQQGLCLGLRPPSVSATDLGEHRQNAVHVGGDLRDLGEEISDLLDNGGVAAPGCSREGISIEGDGLAQSLGALNIATLEAVGIRNGGSNQG